ncbi:MAG TPA: homocysteine methyltransferase, partial [Eubacteriaceae bacterium]|nr:homocysteine methyltransferase [Eubacteriaceae bacterium]
MNIQDRLKKGRLIFDGAMGTQIQKMETNPIIPEVLNIESSEDITEIHRRYIEAGAQVITTNTFNANPLKLQKAGLEVKQVVTQGVACAKEASKGKEVYVALDMGPIGQLLEPAGTLTFDQAYDIFKEQVIAGEKAGADLVLIETMSDIYEMKSAVLAVKENTKLPVFCTMTFAENQKTMNGTDAQTLVTYLEALKVDVLGVNCSTGPNKLKYVVEDILQYASIPVMVQPNAGLPVFKDGKTEYDIDKTEFVQEMEKMIRKGVHVVGGCCGTSPDYIEMLVKAMENIPEQARLEQEQENDFPTVASSYRKTVAYDGHLVVVSENLIAAFKRELREGIEKSDYGKFSAIARKDKKAGADLINLNAFVPGTDEEMHLPRIIKSIQRSNDLPIQVESRNEKALEQALRYYNGKAVVNGINASQESMEKIFPLLARY